MPDKRIERLGLHLGITITMLQRGTHLTLLQQQLITLRSVAKAVIDGEDMDPEEIVTLIQLIPESLAEELTSDQVIPSDIGDLDWDQLG